MRGKCHQKCLGRACNPRCPQNADDSTGPFRAHPITDLSSHFINSHDGRSVGRNLWPELSALLGHRSRDRRALHLALHVHDHSSVVLEVDGDALLPAPRLLLADHHCGHHLLPQLGLTLLHGAHAHVAWPRVRELVQAASDALHGHDGQILGARVVRAIHDAHDAHTDAHLELVTNGYASRTLRHLDVVLPVSAVADGTISLIRNGSACQTFK